MDIGNIRAAIRANRFRITDHADEEAQADRLTLADIVHSAQQGEVIKDYTDDRSYRAASCTGARFKAILCTAFGRTMRRVAGLY
jgi:hypothetical protein